MIRATTQEGDNVSDETQETHAGRGPDDVDSAGQAPTVDVQTQPAAIAAASPATLDRFAGITPGEVVTDLEVDQSGQVDEAGAREWQESEDQ